MKYAVLVLLCLSPHAFGQCINGVCPVPVSVGVPVKYEWRPGDRPEVRWLYLGGVVVGGWNGEIYMNHDPVTGWAKVASEPPVPLPKDAVKVKAKAELFPGGVDVAKIQKGRTSVNGRDVEESRAFEALTAGLVDDSKKLRLTVYGDGREDTVSAWRSDPKFADIRPAFHVHSYPKDHWAVKDVGLVHGDKGVVIQGADGKVLHRSGDLDPEKLHLAAVAALRKRDPNYDPKNDPDLTKSVPEVDTILSWLKSPGLLGLPNFVAVGAAILVFLKFRKKKEVVS